MSIEKNQLGKLFDCIDEMNNIKGLIIYHNMANEVFIRNIHEKNHHLNDDEIYGLGSLNDIIKEKLEHFYNNLLNTIKDLSTTQKQIKD